MFFLYSIDPTNLIDKLKEFLTTILVTIPQNFVSANLDSGVLRTIWLTFFGNANVIKAFFILALVSGFYLFFSNQNNLRSGRSKF